MTESIEQTRTADEPPSPSELRTELERLVVGDLLGPADGEHERLDARQFRRMRDRYRAGGSTMFPSAFGLSFVVERSTESVVVTASWGRYEKEVEERAEPGEEAPRWWQRVPVEGSRELRLDDTEIARFAPVEERPEVSVRGRVLEVGDYRVIDLFLVNN